MSELSTSFSSIMKAQIVVYSDKMNHLTEQMFSKINNLIKLKKYNESQQYLNLISLMKPLSTIEYLNLYFYSFEINKHFYILYKNNSKNEKTFYSANISSDSVNNNIYLMRLLYCIKKMMKYFNNYTKELQLKIKKIILSKIYQFCLIIHKEKEFLMEYYYISELIENEKYTEIMDSNMQAEIYKRKYLIYTELNKELNEQKKKFTKNLYSSEYEILKKNFIDETFNLYSKELKEGDNCYLISTHWIRTYIYYLNIISQESNNEENDNELGELLFQFSKTFNLYYKPNLDFQKFFIFAPAYPGPLNNFNICGNCDFWFDPKKGEEYTNQFLTSKTAENSYQIVDEYFYELLIKLFGRPINEISRKVHFKEKSSSFPEIEIHLLKYRILILCKSLLNDDDLLHLIRLKKIQISKEKTFNNLVTKIIRGLNYEVELIKGKKLIEYEDERKMKFHIIIPDFIDQEKDKNILYNILDCYYNKYSSFIGKISGKEINEDDLDKKLEEMKIGEEDVIIIEFVFDKNENFFLNIKSEDDNPKCMLCSETITSTAYPCKNCNLYFYCSEKCRKNDKKHINYHKNVEQFYKRKYELHDILSVDIRKILNPKSRHGLIGLRKLGDTCFMNSAIQCLSSVEELTKYFLLKKYLEEINKTSKSGAKGKIAEAYYSLISELWNGN